MPNITPTSAAAHVSRTTFNSKKIVGDISASVNANLNLPSPFTLPSSMALSQKLIDCNDDYVQNSSIRRTISEQLLRQPEVTSLAWQEERGLLEMGPKINSSIPIPAMPSGLGFSIDVGFTDNSLLAYRSTKAKINPTKREHKLKTKLEFPLHASDAAKMQPGHEVEIRGEGKIQASLGISGQAFAGVQNFANVGASLSVGGKASATKSYVVSVLSIDGNGLVRVTVSNSKDDMKEVGLKLRAGVLKAMPSLPAFGDGALPELGKKAMTGAVTSLLEGFGSVSLSATREHANKDSVVCCYDLDLNKLPAQEAYHRLLQLSPLVVDKMMSIEDCGISKVSLDENETSRAHTRDFHALNRSIYNKRKSEVHHDGMLNRNNTKVVYSDEVFADKTTNYITGDRDMRWEQLTLKDDNGAFHNYYRFFLERRSKFTQQSEVDAYFTLAKKLDVKSTCTPTSELIEMHSVEKLFSSKDNIKAKIVAFFTEEGAKRIEAMSNDEACKAFFKANCDGMDSATSDQALAMLGDYYTLDEQLFSAINNKTARQNLATDYQNKFKRDFKADYAIYQDARTVDKIVGDQKSLFLSLAESGMDYCKILPMLSLIAGRENLKIHELNLSGGHVKIRSEDEGELVHPREEARRLFVNYRT